MNGLRPKVLRLVHSTTISAADLRKVLTGNAVVRYKPSETNKQLNGTQCRELSANLYGSSNWWVLLEKA